MLPFIDFFGRPISSYSLCVLAGLIAAGGILFLTCRKRRDLSYIQMFNIPLFAAGGAVAGAEMLYMLTRLDRLFINFWEAVGGMVFYGGLLGAVAAAYWYCRAANQDFGLYADVFAVAIPAFHLFGRIGCFLAGCCYGMESTWGMVYSTPFAETAVRIPIQLIEAAGNLLIIPILLYCMKKRLPKGSVLAVYFVLYAVLRFTDEFFRGDAIRGHLWLLSTSQWISLLVFGMGAVMLYRRYVHRQDYGVRVKTGDVPEGYVYNRYAGAVAPEDQHLLQGGNQ